MEGRRRLAGPTADLSYPGLCSNHQQTRAVLEVCTTDSGRKLQSCIDRDLPVLERHVLGHVEVVDVT